MKHLGGVGGGTAGCADGAIQPKSKKPREDSRQDHHIHSLRWISAKME